MTDAADETGPDRRSLLLGLLARSGLFLSVLLGVVFSTGRSGMQTDALGRGLGVLGLLAALLAVAAAPAVGGGGSPSRLQRILTALLVGTVGGWVLVQLPRDGRPFVMTACLAVLPYWTGKGGALALLAQRCAVAVAVYGVVALLLTSGAVGHYALEAWARAAAAAASVVSGFHLHPGPTAAGCWLALLAYCLLVAPWGPGGVFRHAPIAIVFAGALVFTTQVAFLLAGPHLLQFLNRSVGRGGHGGYTLPEIGWFLAVLLAFLLAAACRGGSAVTRARGPLRSCLVGGFLAVAAVLAIPPRPAEAAPVRILLHDSGYLDDRVPSAGSFGSLGSGMFGHLAAALESARCHVERRDLSSTPDLSAYDALMVVNPIERFDAADVARIQAFVERGGGFLALGDHTGLGAIREPINEIVADWGIELQFDSAVAFRRSWQDSMEVVPHPATAGIRRSDQVRIWTGASLALRWPATPLVVGRYAYADEGDVEAEERGHLGDMHYRVGERVTDVVLAAAAEPGDGRVLVFGDTSSIQNFSLPDTLPFVAGAVRWACLGGSSVLPTGAREALTLVGLAGLLALAASSLGGSWLVSGLLVAIGTGRAVAIERTAPPWASTFEVRSTAVAAVARCALPVGTDLVWHRSSFGGLIAHLFRAGLRPISPSAPLERWIKDVELLVLPTPARDLTTAQLTALDAWVHEGGEVLMTVEAEQSRALVRLLRHLEIELSPLPLGPAEVDLLGGRARFRCANAIESLPAGADVLARAHGYDCIAWIPRGEGGWLVIADARFLWNENLESEDRYVPENSDALLRILHFLRERA